MYSIRVYAMNHDDTFNYKKIVNLKLVLEMQFDSIPDGACQMRFPPKHPNSSFLHVLQHTTFDLVSVCMICVLNVGNVD